MSIRILSHAEAIAATPVLSDILHATVLAEGSVNFCAPFSPEEARAYWTEDALPSIATGHRLLFAAHQFGMLKGTVSLDLAQQPNQPHRADVGCQASGASQCPACRARQSLDASGGGRGKSSGALAAYTRHLERQPSRKALSQPRIQSRRAYSGSLSPSQ